jgi:hypothetical protein
MREFVPETAGIFRLARKEVAMNPQSNVNIVTMLVVAALSALIAIVLLSAVAGLFLRYGAPYEQVAIAERACASHAFVSEREACARALLGRANVSRVASR